MIQFSRYLSGSATAAWLTVARPRRIHLSPLPLSAQAVLHVFAVAAVRNLLARKWEHNIYDRVIFAVSDLVPTGAL